MKPITWISLTATVVLLVLFPLVFGQVMAAALVKLHLSRGTAILLVIAIMGGGLVNIPVRRIQTEAAMVHPLAVFGLADLWPALWRVRRETIIAVNVGGCLVPVGLAAYEVRSSVRRGDFCAGARARLGGTGRLRRRSQWTRCGRRSASPEGHPENLDRSRQHWRRRHV